jgi:hypothetical protein
MRIMEKEYHELEKDFINMKNWRKSKKNCIQT